MRTRCRAAAAAIAFGGSLANRGTNSLVPAKVDWRTQHWTHGNSQVHEVMNQAAPCLGFAAIHECVIINRWYGTTVEPRYICRAACEKCFEAAMAHDQTDRGGRSMRSR